MIRKFRYLLTRLFFLCMGLRVSKYRKEVEALWALAEAERNNELERLLRENRPLNAAGEEVTSLEKLFCSPPLSKQALREQDSQKPGQKAGKFGRHTAGTTGEPTNVSLSRNELGRMLGVRDYCFRHYGVKLGQREARLWGRPESGFKYWIKNFVMNRRVFHPVGPESRSTVVDMLRWRPDYLYGYTSLLLEAARILEDVELEFDPPKCVVCTAESILPSQKAYISQAFRAPIAEEYGSTEFDVIAFECTEGHRHLVNPWLVAEEDKANGLISDTSRSSQNLIRYQLGDLFTVKDSACKILGNVAYIEQLQGRTLDRFFYLNNSDKLHASVFSNIFDQYLTETDDIFSFSLKQNAYAKLEVFIDRVPERGLSNLKGFLDQEISDVAGAGVTVEVVVLENRDASKKRNYFVQNIKAPE